MTEHSDPRTTKLYEDLSDEIAKVCITQASLEEQVWKLFFDGASRTNRRGNIIAGVGVVLVSPQNYVIYRTYSLAEPCSNNVAEYNDLLIGMQLVEEIGVKYLEAYCNSKLIVNQILRRSPRLDLLKFAWSRHPSKNKSGNYSSMTHQERVLEKIM